MFKSSSRIEEAFDRPLRSLDELRGVNLYGVDAFVWSHEGVEACAYLLHHRLHVVERQFGPVHGLIIGVDEGYQMLAALYHEALSDKGQIVELGLNLLGIYVLPRCTQYHGLGAAFDG